MTAGDISVEEKRSFALARMPDAERLLDAAERAYADAPRGSQSAGERWREMGIARRALNELAEMIAGPEPLSAHSPPVDAVHAGLAATPPHWMAAAQAERRAHDPQHDHREPACLDALSSEQRDQLRFVVERLGASAAAELELPRGVSAGELTDLAAGRGAHDGPMLGAIAKGLPRALAVAQGQVGRPSFRPYDAADAAARGRGWNPGGTR